MNASNRHSIIRLNVVRPMIRPMPVCIITEKQIINGYNSGNGRTITYVYDDKGMVLSKLYPVSGDTIHYDRDGIDR